MKKTGTIFLALFLFFFAVVSIAGAYIKQFTGRSEGDGVRIEWQTGTEENLESFVLQRETPQTSFIDVATIQPKGSNSFYSHLDEAILKTGDFIFTYRLKIVETGGSVTYSNKITVSPNVSNVKRTWGSIKAMFR